MIGEHKSMICELKSIICGFLGPDVQRVGV